MVMWQLMLVAMEHGDDAVDHTVMADQPNPP